MDSLVERLKVYADYVAHYHEEADAPLVMEAVARITELERQLKVAREALGEVTDYGDLQAVRIARQALASMEQADD